MLRSGRVSICSLEKSVVVWYRQSRLWYISLLSESKKWKQMRLISISPQGISVRKTREDEGVTRNEDSFLIGAGFNMVTICPSHVAAV